MKPYSDEQRENIIEQICFHVEQGLPIKDACLLSAIHFTTYYDWCEKDPTIPTRIEAALAKYKRALISNVNYNTAKDGKLGLDVLSRRFPEDFGNKIQVDVRDTAQEKINKVMDIIEGVVIPDDKKPDEQVPNDSSHLLQGPRG